MSWVSSARGRREGHTAASASTWLQRLPEADALLEHSWGPWRSRPVLRLQGVATVTYGDFEWDDEKDLTNQRKHGLSFAEARRLFESGANYLEIFDAEHSESEDRFIAIGPVARRANASRLCTARTWTSTNDGHS